MPTNETRGVIDVPVCLQLVSTEVKPVWTIAMARILRSDVTLRFDSYEDGPDAPIPTGDPWDKRTKRMYIGHVPDVETFWPLLETYIQLQLSTPAKLPSCYEKCVRTVFHYLQKSAMSADTLKLFEPGLVVTKARNRSDYNTKYIAALRRISTQYMRTIKDWLAYAAQYATQQQLLDFIPAHPLNATITIRRADFTLGDLPSVIDDIGNRRSGFNWVIIDNAGYYDYYERTGMPPFEVRHLLSYAPYDIQCALYASQPFIIPDTVTPTAVKELDGWITTDPAMRPEPYLNFRGPAGSMAPAEGIIQLLNPCFESMLTHRVSRAVSPNTGAMSWKLYECQPCNLVAPLLSLGRLQEVFQYGN